MMESKIDILNHEIGQCLTKMEIWYPELFQYLDETPVSNSSENDCITESDLKNYLELLHSQMETFHRTHGPSSEA